MPCSLDISYVGDKNHLGPSVLLPPQQAALYRSVCHCPLMVNKASMHDDLHQWIKGDGSELLAAHINVEAVKYFELWEVERAENMSTKWMPFSMLEIC